MYDNEVNGFLEEIMILDETCSNQNIVAIYKRYLSKYPSFKKYNFVIGTNDTSFTNFYLTGANKLNQNMFVDPKDNKGISIYHPYSKYQTLLYLSPELKNEVVTNANVFVDSNTMNALNKKSDQDNELLDFIVKNNIQINYLPYILEDYINPYRASKKEEKTFEKIRNFEIVSNIDKKHYLDTHNIQIDMTLLRNHGYNSLDQLLEDKKFFFSHFFEKKHAKEVICPRNTLFLENTTSYMFNIQHYLSDYNLIYGLVLNILMQRWVNISTYDKLEKIYLLMIKQGRVLKQILHLAYCYYENINGVNKFLTFDKTWDIDKILEKTKNITWDIFLYFKSRDFIGLQDQEGIKIDLSLPFFMTKDHKFYDSFAKDYDYKVVIINTDSSQKTQPYVSVTTPSETTIALDNIIEKIYNSNSHEISKKAKYHKIFKNPDKLHSYSILFKNKMESEAIKIFKN